MQLKTRSETGEQLRQARKAAGLTQAQLAARIGKTTQYVSNYERGTRNPKSATLAAFSEALGFNIEEAAGADDNVRISLELTTTKAKARQLLKYMGREGFFR